MAGRDNAAEMLGAFADAAASKARDAVDDAYDVVDGLSESPIEKALVLAVLAGAVEYGQVLHGPKSTTLDHLRSGDPSWAELIVHGCRFTQFEVWQQVDVGRYRADMVVIYRDFQWKTQDYEVSMLAVECDGHDFHERTKEQARRDKARDRFFTRIGLEVFRFTGSEIYRDAPDCAMQILSHLAKWVGDED